MEPSVYDTLFLFWHLVCVMTYFWLMTRCLGCDTPLGLWLLFGLWQFVRLWLLVWVVTLRLAYNSCLGRDTLYGLWHLVFLRVDTNVSEQLTVYMFSFETSQSRILQSVLSIVAQCVALYLKFQSNFKIILCCTWMWRLMMFGSVLCIEIATVPLSRLSK